MKLAQAGTIESNDCLVMVSPSETLIIEIESIVFEKFGDAIEQTIQEVLIEQNKVCKVKIIDKGAYDYTVRARLITALRRAYE
jgi:citrate lyase subunit gamma (acyl carrier protein)